MAKTANCPYCGAEWYVYDDEYDECSNCNYLHAKKGPDGQDTACSYCPACGAKMELTGTEEEEQDAWADADEH